MKKERQATVKDWMDRIGIAEPGTYSYYKLAEMLILMNEFIPDMLIKEHMPKKKSKKQVRYLMSKGSPLSAKQKGKLKRELKSGAVRTR